MTKVTSVLFPALLLAAVTACSNDAGFGAEGQAAKSSDRQRTKGEPETDKEVDEPEMEPALESSATDTEVGIGTETDTVSFEEAIKTESVVTMKDGVAVRVERDFEVASLLEGELEFDFTRGVFEQGLTLANDYAATNKELFQIDRPSYSRSFQQGTAGMSIKDSDTQNGMGVLDIVVVIDNSGSMSQEQANLSTKLAPLLEFVTGSDWTINVVTTDVANGCTRQGLIKKGAANATTAFQTAVTAGIGGDGNEQGILQAVNALSCSQVMDFPRPGSSIAVLIVSDEDNCSANAAGCAGQAWSSYTHLTTALQNLGRTPGKDARLYGIFWHPDVPKTQCSTGGSQGVEYAKGVEATGGVHGSICSTDYSPTLRKISQDMATILKSQMTLSATPDPGSVVVKVNGVEMASGWSRSDRIITFTDVPPPAATIDVFYTVGASEIKTRFPLGETPALSTLEVIVGGAMTDKAAYSFDAGTKELVFTTPPADNAEIVVNFRGDLPLLTDFALGEKVRSGSLTVKVAGKATTAFTLTDDGVLKLAEAPRDGVTVSATFLAYRGKRLDYPTALVGKTIKNLAVVDAETGAAVDASYANGLLSVAEAEHTEGRKLLVRHENETSEVKAIELSQVPEANSVVLEGGPKACLDGLSVDGRNVTYTCAYSADGALTLRFKYRAAPASAFSLGDVDKPDTGVWQVFVDGVETKAYERQGKTITLLEPPAAAAIVKIVWAAEL